MLGWHFLSDSGLLRNGYKPPADGDWLEYSGILVPCESGLHFSEHPYDALQYAPGAILCRVECEGDLQSHGDPVDKWVCRRRKILWRQDITAELREFARQRASEVLHLWDAPQVVKDYLATGDDSLRSAARSAAESAAESAAKKSHRQKFLELCESVVERLRAAKESQACE